MGGTKRKVTADHDRDATVNSGNVNVTNDWCSKRSARSPSALFSVGLISKSWYRSWTVTLAATIAYKSQHLFYGPRQPHFSAPAMIRLANAITLFVLSMTLVLSSVEAKKKNPWDKPGT